MQNDPEAISCEPLGEGGDSRVAGTDHFTEGPPGEGTSLTVNVKYDLLTVRFEMYENVCTNGFLIFGRFLECTTKHTLFM